MRFFILAAAAIAVASAADKPFVIRALDEETGRAIPLVELRTVSYIRYYTDNNGVAAIDDPALMDRTVYFSISSHGYEYPADGFQFRGRSFPVTAGGTAEIRLKRINIAERLYRITGEGMKAGVTGQDSVMVAPYQGKLFWFWGDTNLIQRPLGIFAVTGATSDMKQPPDFRYFSDSKGIARAVCNLPGKGVKWIGGLFTVNDESGRERLIAHVERRDGLKDLFEQGLVIWNDGSENFEWYRKFDIDERMHPRGQTLRIGGMLYFSLPNPNGFPNARVNATLSDVSNPRHYEGFSCLEPKGRLNGRQTKLDRDAGGKLRCGWKMDTEPWNAQVEKQLIDAGLLKESEALYRVRDAKTGKPVVLHAGSAQWNEFRKRFILIATEIGGTSHLGEIWYSESVAPEGPWTRAIKVITHNDYTFYNPAIHPFYNEEGGRAIYFEGTYTDFATKNPRPTPRYNYNQIMYRLRLDDARLGGF